MPNVDKENEKLPPLPLLIAKDKDAVICKDDYHLGWLVQNDANWYWMVWGACKDRESAIRAKDNVLKEKGERQVFFSKKPLSRKGVQTEKLELKILN